MTDGKEITSYSLSPEAQGEVEYADTSIASNLKYPCSYCMEEFYLVNPYTQISGGAIQRELAKHKDTGVRQVRMNPETYAINRDNDRGNLFFALIVLSIAVVTAIVLWWEIVEVPRLLEGSCERIVSEEGRSSYPSRLKCS